MSGKIKWLLAVIIIVIAAILIARSASTPSEEVPGESTVTETAVEGGDELSSIIDGSAEESLLLGGSDSDILEAGEKASGEVGNVYDENTF